MALTTLGMLHAVGASVGLVTGAFQLLRPQRDQLHRRVVHVPGWLSALIGTPPVILDAWFLIRRYAPALRPPQQPAQ